MNEKLFATSYPPSAANLTVCREYTLSEWEFFSYRYVIYEVKKQRSGFLIREVKPLILVVCSVLFVLWTFNKEGCIFLEWFRFYEEILPVKG